MPTAKKGEKKRAAKKATKKATKKRPVGSKGSKGAYAGGSKGGSKGGSSGGGGGGADGILGNDPIVIAGGGSVSFKFRPGQFNDKGGGRWKNDTADLISITITDPMNPTQPPVIIPLTRTSQVSVKLS